MSFGSELSNDFHKLTNGVFYGEVQLFTKLQDAFANMKSNSKFGIAIDIIHGSKSFVEFKHDAKYIANLTTGCTKTRELSDMLFVVFKTQGQREIRLMYMQNKKGDISTKFTADLLQLHLLRERKEILSNPLPPCVFDNSKILSKAVLPSVGSFGVFYQANTGKVEMAYYPAERIKLCNQTGGVTRKVYYDSQQIPFGTTNIINGYKESQGEESLEDFANALVRMEIGSPMLKDPAIYSLVQFLYSNSPVFKECFGSFDIQVNQEPVSTNKMPFVCVINADLISKSNDN